MSYYSKSKSAIEGLDAEKRFEVFMEERGLTMQRTRESMNMVDHVDFFASMFIDVKKMKKISRKDTKPNDTWIWLELKGHTTQGWLYGTKSDFIAFELKKGWLLVQPSHLIALAEDIVDHTKWVDDPYEAQYKLYSRKGKNDIITLLETKEIKKIGTVWR